MTNEVLPDDEQRLCPTCRMAISTWATRCRYCGVDVGRPRRDEQTITVQDLGGEQSTTYTLSGNVKDALEAFRAEQEVAMDAVRHRDDDKGSWFNHKHPPEEAPQAAPKDDSFTKLDAAHRDLSRSIVADTPKPRIPTMRPRGAVPDSMEGVLKIGGIALAVVFSLLILYMAYGKLQAYLGSSDQVARTYMNNEALEMLKRGEPLIDAFEESVRVANFNGKEEDRVVMEQLRGDLVEQIKAFLNMEKYLESDHRTAARLVERGVTVDPSSALKTLKEEVDGEMDAYSLMLKKMDTARGTATFDLYDDKYRDANGIIKHETVSVHGRVQRRFSVESIDKPNGVVMTDGQRGECRIRIRKVGAFPYAFDR